MMWQDLVFMIGSGFSVVTLGPTLRDASARVPLGTSIPSMSIGFIYAFTFFTLGMSLSALGALAAGTMWSLIATFRSPTNFTDRFFPMDSRDLFVRDLKHWIGRRRSNHAVAEQYASTDGH